MAADTDGYGAALETIEVGALSEREQRIAAGLALLREGRTMKRAASEVQIPRTTLMRYAQGVSKLGTSNSNNRQRLADVEDLSHDIARIAGEAVRESLSTRPEDWKPGDLVKAYGVATDKILAMNQRPQTPTDPGVDTLAQLLQAGASVTTTITPADPIAEAETIPAAETAAETIGEVD